MAKLVYSSNVETLIPAFVQPYIPRGAIERDERFARDRFVEGSPFGAPKPKKKKDKAE